MDNTDFDWFDMEEADEMESWCASGEMIMEDYEHNKEIYNQALDDFEMKIKECCSIVGNCDYEDMERIKKQLKR